MQYGVNHPGGAEVLVGIARARAKHFKRYIMIKIDVRNAIGELDQSVVLRRVSEKIPSMASLVANIFQPGTSSYRIEGDHGEWDECSPVAGVEQGSSAASPLFGTGMAIPLQNIALAPVIAWCGVHQDYVSFQVPVAMGASDDSIVEEQRHQQ